jgi:hypothetical protein
VPRLEDAAEPATIRAPALQPRDAPAPASRAVPRAAESSRTLPGVTDERERAFEHAARTVELSSDIMPREPLEAPPARAQEIVDEKLEALPGFSEAEDTSPKMNLSPLNPPLFVDYAGRRSHVNHPRFVIGRERTMCHLVLPDSNVSRQHAAVEWHDGQYYLVDLGSTNGVGCGGHRIHRKQIVEGDRFEICGHTITFSFRL